MRITRGSSVRLENLCGESGFTSTGKTCGEIYLLGMLYQVPNLRVTVVILFQCTQMHLVKPGFLDAYPKFKAWFDTLCASEGTE